MQPIINEWTRHILEFVEATIMFLFEGARSFWPVLVQEIAVSQGVRTGVFLAAAAVACSASIFSVVMAFRSAKDPDRSTGDAWSCLATITGGITIAAIWNATYSIQIALSPNLTLLKDIIL